MTNPPEFRPLDLDDPMQQPYTVKNCMGGEWIPTKEVRLIPNPMNGTDLCVVPKTQGVAFAPFEQQLRSCPKSGLHNPLKNVERYITYGEVCMKLAHALAQTEIAEYFALLICMVVGKSMTQCRGEVTVTRKFLENFAGDAVRFLAYGRSAPGDRAGQQSHDYRWPYGPVMVIYPFNFPIEIPVLQMFGALFMGNSVVIKGDSKVSIVMQEFLKLAFSCGLPPSDVAFVNAEAGDMYEFVREMADKDVLRMLQFTGSSRAAHALTQVTGGRIRIEDSGFDPKVYGPDFHQYSRYLDFVARIADNDAYAAAGQKCSATSMSYVHMNWWQALIPKLKELALKRNLTDRTNGPVLTWTTEGLLQHIQKLAQIPGSEIMWGGKALEGHSIPAVYGAIEPTAVYVPLEELQNAETRKLVHTEVFGPVQVFVDYDDSQVDDVIADCEAMDNNLTMALVSNDQQFRDYLLGRTVNGTVYDGIKARTTGAPQNHFFGPAGKPLGAGIGTADAIIQCWSTNRTVIKDTGEFEEILQLPVQS